EFTAALTTAIRNGERPGGHPDLVARTRRVGAGDPTSAAAILGAVLTAQQHAPADWYGWDTVPAATLADLADLLDRNVAFEHVRPRELGHMLEHPVAHLMFTTNTTPALRRAAEDVFARQHPDGHPARTL